MVVVVVDGVERSDGSWSYGKRYLWSSTAGSTRMCLSSARPQLPEAPCSLVVRVDRLAALSIVRRARRAAQEDTPTRPRVFSKATTHKLYNETNRSSVSFPSSTLVIVMTEHRPIIPDSTTFHKDKKRLKQRGVMQAAQHPLGWSS